jgi:hypothetical protein
MTQSPRSAPAAQTPDTPPSLRQDERAGATPGPDLSELLTRRRHGRNGACLREMALQRAHT